MSFSIEELQRSDACVVLAVAGRVSALTAVELKARLRRLVDDGARQLVLDLERVEFIESTGLAALVSALKSTREAGGWLRLAGPSQPVRTIFRATMLERVFDTYPSVAAALAGRT